MTPNRDQLIFGRYNREDCGLPALENPALAKWRFATRSLAILVAVLFAGWLAGGLAARWRALRLEALPGEVARAAGTGEAGSVLAKGRMLATALRGNPRASLGLAEAAFIVSQDAPRQIGYYGNIDSLLEGTGERLASSPVLAYRAESLHSAILLELGRHEEALAALARADKALAGIPDGPLARALRLNMVNQQAYILATADSPRVGNSEKALHLAQIMISSRDALPGGGYASASAAFVDTLAAAWFAAGQGEKALEAQTLALGLASPGDLAVYLKHYDLYASAGASRHPRLMAWAWR